MAKTIVVKQIGSPIRRPEKQRRQPAPKSALSQAAQTEKYNARSSYGW